MNEMLLAWQNVGKFVASLEPLGEEIILAFLAGWVKHKTGIDITQSPPKN
jgi:hypothetical protein